MNSRNQLQDQTVFSKTEPQKSR